MEDLSNPKRGVEDDTQGNQDGDDQLPTNKKAKLDDEDSKDEEEKKEPTISEKYNSDDADITLISSDNVAFKVHSYQLMAASTVFRSMLSMPSSTAQRDAIRLSDEVLEHSWVLEALLGIVYTSDLKFLAKIDRAYLVIDLADKWDFVHVRPAVHGAMGRDTYNKSTSSRFEMALKLKDAKLAASWIRSHHNVSWTQASTDNSDNLDPFTGVDVSPDFKDRAPALQDCLAMPGERVFDIGTWAYWRFLKLSPTTAWALLRATHVGTTQHAKLDHNKVATEFERLLTLAYKPEAAEAREEST